MQTADTFDHDVRPHNTTVSQMGAELDVAMVGRDFPADGLPVGIRLVVVAADTSWPPSRSDRHSGCSVFCWWNDWNGQHTTLNTKEFSFCGLWRACSGCSTLCASQCGNGTRDNGCGKQHSVNFGIPHGYSGAACFSAPRSKRAACSWSGDPRRLPQTSCPTKPP
jgi:hypothetical protein